MHAAWEDDGPAARFMRRLVRERAVEFMRSPDYLLPLRFDYERARRDQKHFGHIWAEYGTDVFQLIAEAHGEDWDAEDDEKQKFAKTYAPARKKKEASIPQRALPSNDDVVATCEKGARERVDKLQGKPEARVRLVEEDQGQIGAEEEARQAEGGRDRGDEFYARAGGTTC